MFGTMHITQRHTFCELLIARVLCLAKNQQQQTIHTKFYNCLFLQFINIYLTAAHFITQTPK